MMRRRARIVALGLVGALLLLGACGVSGRDSDASGSADGVSEQEVEAAADGRPLPEQGDPVDGDRRVVYTASLRLRVDDPSASAAAATDVAAEADGSLDSQNEDADDEVRLTVRVPSDRFDEVFDDLAALGTVLDRSVETDDVTDQVVDLQGRLANAEASVERLRALFADAQDVNQVVSVENALTEREAEVEGLAGQLQVLEDEADRSTITMTFTQEGEPEVDDDIPGFLEGLRTGWVAFRNVAAVAVTALGFLLPFLLVAIPLALAGRWWVRRRRRNAPPRPAAAAIPGYPPAANPAAPPAPPVSADLHATSWPTPEAGTAEPAPSEGSSEDDDTTET